MNHENGDPLSLAYDTERDTPARNTHEAVIGQGSSGFARYKGKDGRCKQCARDDLHELHRNVPLFGISEKRKSDNDAKRVRHPATTVRAKPRRWASVLTAGSGPATLAGTKRAGAM